MQRAGPVRRDGRGVTVGHVGRRRRVLTTCSLCVMARMVRTEKVAAAWKVAAKHGSCWAAWASSCHPGFRPAESPQRSFRRWLASVSLAPRERERGGTWRTWLLHTDESVPSTTAAQTDNKTQLTYSFENSPSTKQHKRLICWHTTTGGGDPSFRLGTRKSGLGTHKSGLGMHKSGLGTRKSGLGTRKSGLGTRKSGLGTRKLGLGTRKSGLGSPVARRGRRRRHGEGSARRGWANGVGGVSGLSMGGVLHSNCSEWRWAVIPSLDGYLELSWRIYSYRWDTNKEQLLPLAIIRP